MLKFGKCKQNCCICAYDEECHIHSYEDNFSLATKETLIDRLDNKKHKDKTLIMIRTLKREYGYKYQTNYMDTQDWFDFDKDKPDDGQWVMAIDSEGNYDTYYYDKDWENCLCKYDGNLKVFNITHWMSLPEPPEEHLKTNF